MNPKSKSNLKTPDFLFFLKYSGLIIGALSIVAILIFISYLVVTSKIKLPSKLTNLPIPIPTIGTTQVIDTSDWKTYLNSKYNYQLKYPTNWEIATYGYDEINTATGIRVESKCNYDKGERCQQLLINTGIKYIDTYKLEDYFTVNTNNKWPEKLISKEQTTLDGVSALRYEIYRNEFYGSGLNDWGIVDIELIAVKDKQVYKLTYKEMGKDQSLIKTTSDWSDKKSFDQILSTFKFLDSNVTQEEAVDKVRVLPEVATFTANTPNTHIVAEESTDNNSWLIHVYEIKDGHTATFNWYHVDKLTGNIKADF